MIAPISQMRKARHRDVQYLFPTYPAADKFSSSSVIQGSILQLYSSEYWASSLGRCREESCLQSLIHSTNVYCLPPALVQGQETEQGTRWYCPFFVAFISQWMRQEGEYMYEIISVHKSGSEDSKMTEASTDWMVRSSSYPQSPEVGPSWE